ncbi:MAG: hypothetical protein HLX50_17525 [Alteromonadaceae bacterium]|nr:hypothetical protein [Alteromonadaceae bacterium]
MARYHPADLIDHTFRTGHKPSQDEMPPTSGKSVGFKWRAWGHIDKLHPIITQHKPVLFHLFRRNLLEYAASRYMSDHIVPELPEAKEMGFTKFGHSQFKFKELSGDQQQRLREAMDKVHFSIPVDFATDRIHKMVDAKALVEKNYLIHLENNGAKVYHICYEDYQSNSKMFMEGFCHSISVDAGVNLKTQFKKVSSTKLLSQVQNLEDLASNETIESLIKQSEKLIKPRSGI